MKMKSTSEAPSNAKQMKRSFDGAETSRSVRADDTTNAEPRGDCFAQSVDRNILDKQPGFGKVKPTVEEHQTNKGLNTLSSDSRNAPLPEKGVKLNIHGRRRDEHVIGRSSRDVNDDNTVAGEDRL